MDLVKFDFQGHEVRVVEVDDREDWVAKDVCEVLELRGNSPLSGLDEDEKGSCIVGTPGGPQELSTITEAGLYKLILRSRKPQAKAFSRWVTHEVLPSIRRTGGYGQQIDARILLETLRVAQSTLAIVEQLLQRRRRSKPPVASKPNAERVRAYVVGRTEVSANEVAACFPGLGISQAGKELCALGWVCVRRRVGDGARSRVYVRQ